MNKYVKYFLKGMTIFLGVVLILYAAVFIYVSANKQSIIRQVTAEVGKKLNGTVSIGNVELSFFNTFPNASVLLENVVITDSLYSQHHHPFFKGGEIFALLSISKLISKEPPVKGLIIKKAAVYLFTDTSGYTNTYLFSPKKEVTSAAPSALPANNILKTIILREVRITINDLKTGKFHDITVHQLNLRLKDGDSALWIAAKADLLIHHLAFNVQRGSFAKEKTFTGNFNVQFAKKLHRLQFDSIDMNIGGHPFNASGRFDLRGPDPQFYLRIHARNIMYGFAKSLLTPKIDSALSIVEVDQKLDADVLAGGPLKGKQPLVMIRWNVKNADVSTEYFDFEKASFSGSFTNEAVKGAPRLDANSRIRIDHFSAKWNQLPVRADNIEIDNLAHPLLTCDLQSDFSLAALNELLHTNSLQFKNGSCSVRLLYKGPLKKNNQSNSFLNGEATFTDGSMVYTPRDAEMKHVNGRLLFKNSNLSVENLTCEVFHNHFTMNGSAGHLLTLINTEPNKVNINWNIDCPVLNLSAFIYLLKSPKRVSGTGEKTKKLYKTGEKIDAILDQGIVNLHLHAGQLVYKKFKASDAVADISLLQDRYLINNVSMQESNGSIALTGSLVNRKSNFHQVSFDAALTNVDVNSLFSAFSDFGQNGIHAQNIAGKLTAKATGTLGLDDNGKVYAGSVASTINFSLKNGELVHFQPMEKLQTIVFRNRDFDHIRFAELKDRLDISNQEIKINRMEIESNVLSVFVEGVYSMRGNTDISIQVPLSNLKKRSVDYIPENKGVDKNAGRSLYFRGRPGPDGNVQFKADLFNQFGKEKRKENEKVN